jgi:NAD(P)-dependent dehydrogenase (short-subunit alcohol dehydrogenase family)
VAKPGRSSGLGSTRTWHGGGAAGCDRRDQHCPRQDQLSDLTGRLDVVINDAGIIVEALATEITAEQLRSVFETNLFGVASIISAMLPLLAFSTHPRTVNVSSRTASLALTANGTEFSGTAETRMAYAPSKAALNMLSLQDARRSPPLRSCATSRVTPPRPATPRPTSTPVRETEPASTGESDRRDGHPRRQWPQRDLRQRRRPGALVSATPAEALGSSIRPPRQRPAVLLGTA